jgi:hypothetical protein
MTAARRQVLAILADGQPHVWSDVTAAVSLVHRVSLKGASALLRDLISSGEIERHNSGDREPSVHIPGSGES